MTECLSSNSAASGCKSGKTAGLSIAVFVDNVRVPVAPHEAERLAIFEKREGAWAEVETISIRPPYSDSPVLIKAFMEELVPLVRDAQAVAAASISGAAFTAFSRHGKHIFEIAELSPAQLGGIAEDIALAEAGRRLSAEAFEHIRPAVTEIPGVFSLDLVTALEEFPELSSKMILKPFFRNATFSELVIICRHMPPWLPLEPGLTVESKRRGDYLVVTVSKNACGEAAP